MNVGKYQFTPGTDIPSGKKSVLTKTTPVQTSPQPSSSSLPVPSVVNVVPSPSFQNILDGKSDAKLPEKDMGVLADEVKKAQGAGDLKKLKETAQEMESIFLNMMFKSMRSGIDTSGLAEKSYGREVFEDMYYDEVAKKMSKGKGTGLAEMVYKDLVKMYNKTNGEG